MVETLLYVNVQIKIICLHHICYILEHEFYRMLLVIMFFLVHSCGFIVVCGFLFCLLVQVVKVADFGVARVKAQTGVMTAETGTYRWMAPEVW